MDRRAALTVQRLPARQLGRQAAGAGYPALHPRSGLKVLESAVARAPPLQSPLRWNEDGDWKQDYNNLARMPPDRSREAARRIRQG